jgi:hypothetical protein
LINGTAFLKISQFQIGERGVQISVKMGRVMRKEREIVQKGTTSEED